MKRIYCTLYIILFFVIGFLLFKYVTYIFLQQEEFQLFLVTFDNITSTLSKPGGFVELCGLLTTQYYVYPIFAAIANALLITLCAIFCNKSLKRITTPWMSFGASLIISAILVRFHSELCYSVDGTYGLLIMLASLSYVLPLSDNRRFDIISTLSLVVMFWLTGQMVVLYAISLIVLLGLKKHKSYLNYIVILAAGTILALIARYGFNQIPLTKGFEPESYHLNQVIVSSYIYYVWINTTALYLLTSIILYSSDKILKGKAKIIISSVMIFAAVLTICIKSVPTKEKTFSVMTYYLNHLIRNERWDDLIRYHAKHERYSAYNNICLNYALAKKGELGNKMFCFYQQGLSGLIPQADKKYLTNMQLSDIFIATGCPNVAESYLLEELTTARRYSNPRVMKKLIRISEMKGEFELANKYLDIMSKAPMYADWSKKEKAEMNSGKVITYNVDSLLSTTGIESLLKNSIEIGNRTAWEYLGASYLLGKENDRFCSFIKEETPSSYLANLPTHFQEALLIFCGENNIPEGVDINADIKNRYKKFRELFEKKDMSTIYRDYKDTYWNYAINTSLR